MTITVSKIADNTVQITSSGLSNTLANLTNAVAAAMLGTNPVINTGWLLHDSFSSGVIFTQVFKSLNVDGITNKYVILRWDTVHQELNTSCCEGWNETTHVPTNECYTFFNCAPIGYNLSACDLIIMVNPRWVNFMSFLNGENSLWAGVFEMQREDPVDTGTLGLPCFGWISSNLWMLGASSLSAKPLNALEHTLISIPRTKIGSTGIAAAKGMAGDYGVAQVPNWLYPSAVSMPYYLSTAMNKFAYNNWDNNRRLVLPIKPIADYQGVVTNYGQIFGLKMLAPTGGNMNKIKLSVDSDGNFSNLGTLKDQWLMNVNHKPQTSSITTMFSNTSWAKVDIQASTGLRVDQLVSVGAAYYTIVNGGAKLVKINALNSQSTDITTTGILYDLKYDGEGYVYITTSLGLTRLSIVDDTITNLAISGGLQTLSISATTIMCSSFAASATPTVYRVLRSTFALESGTVGDFTAGSATLASFTETSAKLIDAVTDGLGNVYFSCVVATAANGKLVKVTPSGAISYLPLAYISWTSCLSLLDDSTLIVSNQTTATVIQNTQINLNTFTVVVSNALSVFAVTISGIINYKMSSIEVNGVLFVLLRAPANIFSCFAISFGNTITGTLGTGTSWGDLSSVIMGTCPNSAFWTDGARIINNTDTGIRIWSKVNGESCISGTQLGQVALPA